MEVQLFDAGAHLCFDPGEVMERTRVAEVQAMDSRYDTGTREAPMHSWEMSARHEPWLHMGVSENNGTPKSSILIGFSITNHPNLGYPYFWKHPYMPLLIKTRRGDDWRFIWFLIESYHSKILFGHTGHAACYKCYCPGCCCNCLCYRCCMLLLVLLIAVVADPVAVVVAVAAVDVGPCGCCCNCRCMSLSLWSWSWWLWLLLMMTIWWWWWWCPCWAAGRSFLAAVHLQAEQLQ